MSSIIQLLPLDRIGARETSSGRIDFGLFLPWVSTTDGNRLWVKVIHERDQFPQDVQPATFELDHSIDQGYGDYCDLLIFSGCNDSFRFYHPPIYADTR